jgi:hypothetical protein
MGTAKSSYRQVAFGAAGAGAKFWVNVRRQPPAPARRRSAVQHASFLTSKSMMVDDLTIDALLAGIIYLGNYSTR